MDNKITQSISLEEAPRLRVVKVEAKTFGEAVTKAGGNPAGKKELDWVIENVMEARKVLNEDNVGYCFPGASVEGHIPYIYWDKGKFNGSSEKSDYAWPSFERIVLLG